jgi:hypothetical protein
MRTASVWAIALCNISEGCVIFTPDDRMVMTAMMVMVSNSSSLQFKVGFEPGVDLINYHLKSLDFA